MRRIAPCLALAALLGCGESSPTVTVAVVQGTGAPDVSGLVRLTMEVRACEVDAPIIDTELPVTGAAPAPQPVDLAPGTPFYVHLQGWLACNPPCVQPDRATTQDCVCVDDPEAPAQILRSEGCTQWTRAEVDRQVTVTLSGTLGLCPPPATACTF